MDIQQLRYYVEIVNTKSYTKAAEKLMVTQPMLTRVIQQLEDELDVKLIERTSKYFGVTDAGKLFYQHALELLQRYNDIFRSIKDMRSGMLGKVRMSIPGVILDVYFSNLLKEFYTQCPNIDISIIEEGSKLTVQSLSSDQVDLGLVMLPVHDSYRFHIHTIASSECQLVAPSDHPFATRKAIAISELQNERIITFSDTATLHDSFIELCGNEGFYPHIAYKSLMPNFIFEMVANRLCIAVMPYPVIKQHITEGLVGIPFSPRMPWTIGVIQRRERYQSYASKRLLDFICDYFKKL